MRPSDPLRLTCDKRAMLLLASACASRLQYGRRPPLHSPRSLHNLPPLSGYDTHSQYVRRGLSYIAAGTLIWALTLSERLKAMATWASWLWPWGAAGPNGPVRPTDASHDPTLRSHFLGLLDNTEPPQVFRRRRSRSCSESMSWPSSATRAGMKPYLPSGSWHLSFVQLVIVRFCRRGRCWGMMWI